MKKKHEKEQLALLLKVQDKGFNVVSCGDCGCIFIHETGKEELTCPFCEFKEDICEFPDLFY